MTCEIARKRIVAQFLRDSDSTSLETMTRGEPMTGLRADSRDELQTLGRGLRALSFLNSNGPTTLTQLARQLVISRAAAHRIMMTLLTEGYCRRVPNSHLYLVSPAVGQLSSGMQSANLLTNVAMDLIGRLGTELQLPVALAVPSGTHMRVLLATDRSCPNMSVKIAPGYQAPMLITTTGLLYLGLEREVIREHLISELLGPKPAEAARSQLDLLLEQARRQTFMILDTRFPDGSLGVPVMHQALPVGGLVIRYDKYAITRQQAVSELLPRLRAVAVGISAGYTELFANNMHVSAAA